MDYKVSVIVPVYNVENYLKQALDSVVNQTLKEIEIICINDGSKDSSRLILDKFQQADERISVVNKSNKGYGAACNTGLKLARGKYAAILEPDDFINKDMYEKLYTYAEMHNADVVKSSYNEYTEENGISKINWSKEYLMPESVFRLKDCAQFMYFHPSIWSCLYKTEFLRKNKIFFVEEKGAGWVDNPFQIQTLCLAERIFYTDNAYYNYRLTNPFSSSNIVNISNPFDRSDEVHAFLDEKAIDDANILLNLYKRELGYIDVVLKGVPDNLFDYACKRIIQMVNRMNPLIINGNTDINDYERYLYNCCHSYSGIESYRTKVKETGEAVKVVS